MTVSLVTGDDRWTLANQDLRLCLSRDPARQRLVGTLAPANGGPALGLWTGFAGITGHVTDYFLTTVAGEAVRFERLEATKDRVGVEVSGMRVGFWDVRWRVMLTREALEIDVLALVGRTTRPDNEVDLLAFEVPPELETVSMRMDSGYIFPPKEWFAGPPPRITYGANDGLGSVLDNRLKARFAGDGHDWMELHFPGEWGLRVHCWDDNYFFYVPRIPETEPAPRLGDRLPRPRYVFQSHERFGLGTPQKREQRTYDKGERLHVAVRIERVRPEPVETLRLELPDADAAETVRRYHRTHAHSCIGHQYGFSGGCHNAGMSHKHSVSFENFMHGKAHLYSVHPGVDRLFRNSIEAVAERETRPDGFLWVGGMGGRGAFHEGNASMLIFLADYVRRTGDTSHVEIGRKWLEFIERHLDDTGLFRVPSSTGVARPGAGAYVCQWWDVVAAGGYDGYINVLTYPALRDFAEVECLAGNHEEADRVARLAERLRKGFNRQLWDESAGRYIGWLDTEGGKHDAFYTYINTMAVHEGIADAKRGKAILDRIDAKLAEVGYKGCSLPCNLEPIPPTEYNAGDWWIENYGYPHYYDPFGIYENGGIWIWTSAYYAGAWGRYDPDHAYRHICGILDLYRRDNLYGAGNGYFWDPKTGEMLEGSTQEPYLCNTVMCLWGLYTLFGIELGIADGLRIRPHLPRALDGSRVGFRYRGKIVEAAYTGHGARVGALSVDGREVDPDAAIAPESLREGSRIEVRLR